MEEEKKDSKGLKIGLILFLVLCLIGSGVFIYKRTYVGIKKEETKEEEKVEIPNIENILKMIPVKLDNGEYSSYKVSELTDKEINNAIINYIVNFTELTTKDNEKYYLEKLSNVEDNLFNLLGLTNYEIKYDVGNDDIRYSLEKVTENDIDYIKVKLTLPGTDGLYSYKLQDLDNIAFDKDKNEYIVNVLVIRSTDNTTDAKIGKANIYLKSEDGKTILEKLEFEKYNETDPIE